MDPYYQYLLHQCQHPELHERLRALDTLGKDYLDLIEADFLLALPRGTSRYEEQSAILGIMSQMGARAPVAALIELLEHREAAEWGLREYVAATLAALKESTLLDLFIRLLQDPMEEGACARRLRSFWGPLASRCPSRCWWLPSLIQTPISALLPSGRSARKALAPRWTRSWPT